MVRNHRILLHMQQSLALTKSLLALYAMYGSNSSIASMKLSHVGGGSTCFEFSTTPMFIHLEAIGRSSVIADDNSGLECPCAFGGSSGDVVEETSSPTCCTSALNGDCPYAGLFFAPYCCRRLATSVRQTKG